MPKKSALIRPPVMVEAGLFHDLIYVVAMHREMCDAMIHHGTPSPQKLKRDRAAATSVLTKLRQIEAEIR